MPKTHAPYPAEHRRRVVQLARAGRSTGSLAREFKDSTQTIRNWIRQTDLDEGRRSDQLRGWRRIRESPLDSRAGGALARQETAVHTPGRQREVER